MAGKGTSKLGWILFAATLGVLGWLGFSGKINWNGSQGHKTKDTGVITDSLANRPKQFSDSEIPDYVYTVLNYVTENNKAMEGYKGGRVFTNREKRLPLKDEKGGRIVYREWDVKPLKKGVNRGAERLITSDHKKAYYTKDHYQTFIEIKE